MKNKFSIDVVSDVSCPWCIIGYQSLNAAIQEMGVADSVELNWRPFELNPTMPAQGQDRVEHLRQKDGGTLEQMVISGEPLTVVVLAKVFAYWTISGLPLVLLEAIAPSWIKTST